MMGKVVFGLIMSLDGFVNDRNGDVSRLYPDMEGFQETEVIQEAIRTTGAVVMGRGAYEMAQGDFTGYEFQVPIFVLTHHIPDKVAKGENDHLRFHFVTSGLESAIEQAKAAAGDKDVTVIGGANTAQQLIRARLFDELQIDVAPILLGEGTRLFDHLGAEPIELQQIGVLEYQGITQLRFRAAK
jgi:dihydrofolate reductase